MGAEVVRFHSRLEGEGREKDRTEYFGVRLLRLRTVLL